MGPDELKIKQREFFSQSVEAARRKDMPAFFHYLHESRFMDGASRTLQFSWRLDREKTHEVLATATDKFYKSLSEGKEILFCEAYLFKIIQNEAANCLRKEQGFDEYHDEVHSPTQTPGEPVPEQECEESSQEDRKKQGIEIARSLIPKIGSDNVQSVMRYIIDAVEAGVMNISSRDISDALGLSETSVRKWKQRGFERLRRAAIEAGYRLALTPVEPEAEPEDDYSL